jgi:hypothetical protein
VFLKNLQVKPVLKKPVSSPGLYQLLVFVKSKTKHQIKRILNLYKFAQASKFVEHSHGVQKVCLSF